MNFRKPAEGANMYVCFVYFPQKIINHIQAKVSVAMNADRVNTKCTDKNSSKEVFSGELEGYFR